MNNTTTAPKTFKSRFVLSRQNQKGQVAIFVALIFQVIFIFFALLINVGLLVHHKINLQHSVDLAAYYGAMKQAESMNAIAHINFQMRQAWKLFTWRYRVLGTFGFQKTAGDIRPNAVQSPNVLLDFPFEARSTGATSEFHYYGSYGRFGRNVNEAYVNGVENPSPQADNRNNPALTCRAYSSTAPGYIVDGAAVGPHDIPFFCVGHSGFSEWPQRESNCQLDCSMYSTARPIRSLPPLLTTNTTVFNGTVAGSVNAAIAGVNRQLSEQCNKLTQVGAIILARYLIAYAVESRTRSETIKILAKNLSLPAEDILDLDGKKILDGSLRTFENNLTGANFTGFNRANFQTYNGLSDTECSFRSGDSEQSDTEFLKEIDFKALSLFVHTCKTVRVGGNDQYQFAPEAVYTTAGLNPIFASSGVPTAAQEVIMSLLERGKRFNVGYEKNPYCHQYYAVKATSEPTIPFLPLSKIKLDAVAVAKPFGGSIGPSFGNSWPKGNAKSNPSPNPTDRVDKTLPSRDFPEDDSIKSSVYTQPNFSLFTGDRLGLRNLDYIAAFHSMLAARDIGPVNGNPGYTDNFNSLQELKNGATPSGPKWPTFSNWQNIDSSPSDMRDYDSLASDGPNSAGMRAIEIAAIVPNQFDITYYSIDPDFYNNYYVRLYNSFDAIKNAAGNSSSMSKQNIRPDFGASGVRSESNPTSSPLNPQTFSVRDQILLKNKILDVPPRYRGNPIPQQAVRGAQGNKYTDILNFLVSAQSSLLTGWTFKNFFDYETFPADPVNNLNNTMSFGQCLDDWNKTTDAIATPTNEQNFKTPSEVSNGKPPVPGNCVTGGRTGYSVKIVTPAMVLQTNQDILNPIDQSFFSF